MHTADRLLMDAKRAILQEQHRKFKVRQQQGNTQEACSSFTPRFPAPAIFLMTH